MLVVDDEPAIRLLCKANLELEGYRVLEAGSLDAARRTLDAEQVDVVLLDLHLGGDSGEELVAELADRERPIPVALISGSADAGRVEGAGADAVLGKPFSLEQLSTVVRTLTARSSASM